MDTTTKPPITPPTPTSVVMDNATQAAQSAAKTIGGTYDPKTGFTKTSTTLAQDQEKANRQGTPGFDALGDPIPGYKAPVEPTGTSGGTVGTDAGTPTLPDQADREAKAKAEAEYQATAKTVQDTISNIQNGVTPLTAGEEAQIAGLKQQFQTLIDAQTLVNTGATGTAQIRGAQKGAAEYDPTFQVKTIGSIISAGANKIADLQIKEASAIASLTQSFHDNDIKAIKDSWDIYKEASKNRIDAFQKTIEETAKAIKDAHDEKVAADKVVYDTVTKPIQDLAQIARDNGASPSTIANISNSKSLDEAYIAAGAYAAHGTGIIGEYNYAKANGYTGSFSQYQQEDANRKTVASTGGLDFTTPTIGLGGDDSGGSILNATGLSVTAFNFLTQGTASMSRMTAAQRAQIMNEAQTWLNKHGIDISTFQSQYKAYNDVLQKNIARANQTQIMAGEIAGSADSLISAIDEQDWNKMGNVKAANILKLLTGEQVNDPTTMKYAFQLKAMANDLAGYFAAARGATSPELQDQRDASDVISNGLNKKSVQAFKESVAANEEKVANVVNKAVNSTRKQVWGLFGVSDKFKGGNSTMDTIIGDHSQDQQKVVDFGDKNPSVRPQLIQMEKDGASYSDILNWINQQ